MLPAAWLRSDGVDEDLVVPQDRAVAMACTIPLDVTRFGRSPSARMRAGEEAIKAIRGQLSTVFGVQVRPRRGVQAWSQAPFAGRHQALLDADASRLRFSVLMLIDAFGHTSEAARPGPLVAFLADVCVDNAPADNTVPSPWLHLQVRSVPRVSSDVLADGVRLAVSNRFPDLAAKVLERLGPVVDGHPHPLWTGAKPEALRGLLEQNVAVPVLIAPMKDPATFARYMGGAVTVVPWDGLPALPDTEASSPVGERSSMDGQLIYPDPTSGRSAVLLPGLRLSGSDWVRQFAESPVRCMLGERAVVDWQHRMKSSSVVPAGWVIPLRALVVPPNVGDLTEVADRPVTPDAVPGIESQAAADSGEEADVPAITMSLAQWQRLGTLVDAGGDVEDGPGALVGAVHARVARLTEQATAAETRLRQLEVKFEGALLRAADRESTYKSKLAAVQEENTRLHAALGTPLPAPAVAQASVPAGFDAGQSEGTARVGVPVADVGMAARIAAAACTHLVITEEALSSAELSSYPHPERVLADLLALDDVAGRWRAGLLSDWRSEITGRVGDAYRSGISQTARNAYGQDYQLHYSGKHYLMGPHLARGVTPVNGIRIYWALDHERRRLIVGHIGRKLRDRSNR